MVCCAIYYTDTVQLALSLSGVLHLLSGMLCNILHRHSTTGIITEWCAAFAEWYVVQYTTHSITGIITEWCAAFAEWYVVQ